MVRKMTDDGKGFYHEPPYTEAEEDMIYRGMAIDGPVTILRAPRPASGSPPPPQKSPPPPEEK